MQAADKPKIIKKWQKRYVELRQSSLVYFKNQQQVRIREIAALFWMCDQ